MKTENHFNAKWGKDLKRYSPAVHVVKVSDKFTTGISDFLIWCNGKSMALETKYEDSFPKRDSSLVLSHPFSGSQLTFLESIYLTGSQAWGLVAIGETKRMYMFPHDVIPQSGNFTKEEFFRKVHLEIEFGDVPAFLLTFFNWRP